MRIGVARSNTLWGVWGGGICVYNCVHKTFVNSTVNAASDSLLHAFTECALVTAYVTLLFVFFKG